MNRIPQLHPFIFAAYLPLFVFVNNYALVRLGDLSIALAAALSVAALVCAVCALCFRNSAKSAVLASYIVLVLCCFGDLTGLLQGLAMSRNINPQEAIDLKVFLQSTLSLFFVLLPLAFCKRLAGCEQRSVKLSQALNIVSSVLIVLALSGLIFVERDAGMKVSETSQVETPHAIAAAGGVRPDIYYIVLDGYAREDVLRDFLDYDNRPFVSLLERRGFSVVPTSTANYSWTYLSLASSLNFRYFDQKRELNIAALTRMIRKSEMSRILKGLGYRHLHICSTWTGTSRNEFADKELCGKGMLQNEYFRSLLEKSWFSVFEWLFLRDLAKAQKLSFAALKQVVSEPGPKFVFAHFMLPHHPYLFDRHGKVLRHVTVLNQFDFEKQLWADEQGYVEQLIYANKLMGEFLDTLSRRSRTKPIVVIQSDHGLTLVSASEQMRRKARFANFIAISLPTVEAALPADLSSVNVLRLILDKTFGTNLGYLPTRHFASAFARPFALDEISVSPSI